MGISDQAECTSNYPRTIRRCPQHFHDMIELSAIIGPIWSHCFMGQASERRHVRNIALMDALGSILALGNAGLAVDCWMASRLMAGPLVIEPSLDENRDSALSSGGRFRPDTFCTDADRLTLASKGCSLQVSGGHCFRMRNFHYTLGNSIVTLLLGTRTYSSGLGAWI